MPLAPMRLLRQLMLSRMAAQAPKSLYPPSLVEKSESEDFAGKVAYFVPPALEWNGHGWEQEVIVSQGTRIKFVDAVIGVFYFETPIPSEVQPDWVMIIRDAFVEDGGMIASTSGQSGS